MLKEDLHSLRQVLARAVQASGLLRRDVERALRLRNGSLGRLLDGSLELKVEHLTALARLLRIPPGDLLAAGCPQLSAAAPHRLADWLGPAGSAAPPAAASSPASDSRRAGGDDPRRFAPGVGGAGRGVALA
jgi:hypothetical protein